MSGIYLRGVTIAGMSIRKTVIRDSDADVAYGPYTLPTARAGTLSTRTDDDTGVLTVASGHGITTADTVDVYWSGGVRYGMTVTATAATTIDINLGAGDVLPAQDTAITVCEQTEIEFDLDALDLQLAALSIESTNRNSTGRGHMHVRDVTETSIVAYEVTHNDPVTLDVSGGDENTLDPSVTATFTADNITETITSAGHGLLDGQRIRVSNSGGGLPAGLAAATDYYIRDKATNTFKLAATLGGDVINITTDGTGTQTWTRRNILASVLASNGASDSTETVTLRMAFGKDSTA